jgi:hypothetical protein
MSHSQVKCKLRIPEVKVKTFNQNCPFPRDDCQTMPPAEYYLPDKKDNKFDGYLNLYAVKWNIFE